MWWVRGHENSFVAVEMDKNVHFAHLLFKGERTPLFLRLQGARMIVFL